jgi:hypothetical protein
MLASFSKNKMLSSSPRVLHFLKKLAGFWHFVRYPLDIIHIRRNQPGFSKYVKPMDGEQQ